MIVGIVGPLAAGKDILAEFFKERGFGILATKDVLEEYMMKENMKVTRNNYHVLGEILRNKYGDGHLVRVLISRIKKNRNYVITGFRTRGEIAEFKKLDNSILVSIDADVRTRFDRVIKRNRKGDLRNFMEFKKLDEKERGISTIGEFNVDEAVKNADYSILNNGSIEDLNREAERILKRLLK